MATPKYFNSLGSYILKFVDEVLKDTELCKLLKYSDTRDPALCPSFDTTELLHKQVRLVPILPELDEQGGAYIVILLSGFVVNTYNNDFQVNSVRFDILVPNSDWTKVNETLKPFAIMSRLDMLFNNKTLGGIGILKKKNGTLITLNENLSGYSLNYEIDESN